MLASASLADGQGDHGSARVGGAKMISQSRKLKSYPPAHIKADAANTVDIGWSVLMRRRGKSQEKIFIRGA